MRTLPRFGLLLMSCLQAAIAYDFTALKPQGYLSDFARVVDASAKGEIEKYCASVEASTGAQIAVVTLASLEGEPIEDVANALFRAWGIGQKSENNGILLLLATGSRRSRLEVGYGLEPIMPDGFAGSLLREMRPALRQGDYPDAIMLAVRTIGTRIASAKGVQIQAPEPQPRRHAPGGEGAIPWPVLLVGFAILLSLLGAGSRRGGGGFGGGWLPAMILGNMIGRSSFGGRSNGGFGGYDSGDSFGGFGGGDSGGGGASSDW